MWRSTSVTRTGDRARAIGRELLEVMFEQLTHPHGEALPVRVTMVDGPHAEDWTVTLDGDEEDVEDVRREVWRLAGIREG